MCLCAPISLSFSLSLDWAVIRPSVDTSLGASSCTDTGSNHPRRSIEVLLGTDPASSVRPTDTSAAAAMRASPDATTIVVDPAGLSGTVIGTGYIASLVTDRTGAGSAGCPWLLRAAPWQRINITLIDFTAGMTAASTLTTIDAVSESEDESMQSPTHRHLDGHKTNVWSGSSLSTSDTASYDLDDSASEGDSPGAGQFPAGVSGTEYDENFEPKGVQSPHRRGHTQRQRGLSGGGEDNTGTRLNVGHKIAMSGLDDRRRGGDLQSTLYGVETDSDDDDVDHLTAGRQQGRGGRRSPDR